MSIVEEHEPATTTTVDKEAIRARYRAERDKRLREDGNEQYVEVAGEFAHYLEDPYTEVVPREPLFDEVDVACIGGGFAGLVTGARLKQAGVESVRIIDKGGDVGGTWYWNRYPGAQCDTSSFIYMPLLEEVGHMPTEKYAHAPEIREHCANIARTFGLYENAALSTAVTNLEWDQAASRWIIHTDRGDAIRARFVMTGTGPFPKPKLPGIPGIETYEGHSFHTSRWDYAYTGGTPEGDPMVNLADKRVAIIGTGATAVQCIPHLATACKELLVFQRTPSSIAERGNKPTDPEWFSTLGEGWQQRWLENFCTLQTGGMATEDLVMDGWTEFVHRFRAKLATLSPEERKQTDFMKLFEDIDFERGEQIRARVLETVEDEETALGLQHWYRGGCKRPCFHDEYLHAYNEPGVRLIHTDGRGVDEITPRGLVFDGVEYEVDCIIYASGFEVGTEMVRRTGFDVVGRDGVKLSDYWGNGMTSLHGMHAHGFPNLFVVSPTQGANLISNVPHNLSEGGATVAAIVSHALHNGFAEVECTDEAEKAWVDKLLGGGRRFGMGAADDCTPGYYNNEGKSAGKRGLLNSIGYPEGPMAFFRYIADWRSDGEFRGLEFR